MDRNLSFFSKGVMNWLTGDLTMMLPAPLAQAALAIVALVCGAIIGVEREKQEKPAGLRTLILVCLGSAGFTMAGFAFTSNAGDSGRVAAQIVTGIGFLGAGIILHPRGTISGATTAATVWVTASIGMMAGAGYAGAAVGMTVLVRFVLSAVSMYEARLIANEPPIIATLDFDPDEGRTRVRMERILVDYQIPANAAQWTGIADGMERLTLRIRLPRHHLRALLDDLVNLAEVRKVHEESAGARAGVPAGTPGELR